MSAIVITFASAMMFLLFVLIAGTFGILAWWIVMAAVCVYLIVLSAGIAIGVAALLAKLLQRLERRDHYEIPFGDRPKVPHGS